jgi:hypothetical protein
MQEHCELVLAFVRVLFVNGQSTERIVAAVEQLAKTLGFRVEVMPRWGQLQVKVRDQHGRLFSQIPTPTVIDRHQVLPQ